MRLLTGACCTLLLACGGDNTASNVAAPGADKRTGTRALEAGAALLQDKSPLSAIDTYLDGFHFYNGKLSQQMEAHHYCSLLNDALIQCVIYDGNVDDAKIMGVEYVISGDLFAQLPATEKPLWHSHVHEVKSGQIVAPGLPEVAEHALMRKLIGTYGKTFHTWHTDLGHALPLGVPQIMMGFTADGQINPALVTARDARFEITTADERAQRADIAAPPIAAGADAWQQGRVLQIADPSGAEHGP